jgi:adenylate kinase
MHSAAYRSTQGLGTRGRLVAVFGISGVGKTTLIDQFVQRHKNWQALSASKLLAGLTHLDSEELRLSSRLLVESNQFSLADPILRQRTETPQVNWLLDAHSVIDNDRELIAVSPQVIARIAPDSLIFIQDDALQILRRRTADKERHRPLPSIRRIEEEHAFALQTCLLYSKELKLELHQISANDAQGFVAAIAQTDPATRSGA